MATSPWHYDAHHFPLDSPSVLTAWIPLQPTPREMGPLAFARGADAWSLVADIELDKHGTTRTTASGDWRKFIPGAEPGQVVASLRNPVLSTARS